ncbi:MAG: metallophosphoesterase [Syntrophorhabdus sp.]
MKIAVVSDTHLTQATQAFRNHMRKYFSDADMMFHCGDMTSMNVYDFLLNWDIRAVRGNMDDYDLSSTLPEKRIETIEGKRFGIIHGWGSPAGLEQKVLGSFPDVDAIVFGHSHSPFLKTIRGIRLFNPGSYRGGYHTPGTVGVIDITDTINFRHIEIED